MRFVCQHCDAKYTIADEKVRGKVLRVRCKQCGTTIEVRDPSTVPGAPSKRKSSAPPSSKSSASSTPKAPPPPGKSVLEGKFASAFKPGSSDKSAPSTPGLYDAVKKSAQAMGKRDEDLAHWFAAVDGSPVGPIAARRIHQLQKSKKITDDSLVWKEGMPDWVALRNCKELVGLVARIDLENTGALAPSGEPVLRLGLFGSNSSDAAASPLKGYSVGVFGEHDGEEPDDDSKTQTRIRMDQLFPTPRAKSEVSAKPAVERENATERAFFGADGDPAISLHPVSAGELHSLSPPRASGQNRVMLISAVGLFLVALVLLLIMILKPGETGERIVTKTVEKVVEKVVYRDRPLSPDVRIEDEEKDSSPEKSKGKARPLASSGKSAGVDKGSEVDEKTRALMEQMGVDAASGGGPIGADRPSRQTKTGGAGGSALTPQQIQTVVNNNRAGLQNCYVRALKQGNAPPDQDLRINFKLQVGTSGTIRQVQLSGEGTSNAALKTCLTQSIRKWVFPAAGAESPVEFPIVFSPR
jgi:predicted Zn finger-like uncharacterized protein